VWVLAADGAPEKVAVTVGPSDGKRTEIVKGELKPGQAVIVDSTAAK
jgi:HlyD family secretion protein